MAVHDIFSKRQRRARGEFPDVFQYTEILQPLRVQLVQIIRAGIGSSENSISWDVYRSIQGILCREYGVHFLAGSDRHMEGDQICEFVESEPNSERVLDAVELCLQIVDTKYRRAYHPLAGSVTSPDDCINEVNQRFREHGVGFEYTGGRITRVDSQFLHSEAVKPAISLLADPSYAGPNDEFLAAHEHYRHSRYKECLNDCLKAFESTMKAICTKRGWPYETTDTAKRLVAICFEKGLFPKFLQSHVNNLRSVLESGVPTVRNKQSGHGQGPAVTEVSPETASFVLHTTAANIVLLVEAEKTLK